MSTHEELHSVLIDLRRHLEWQAEQPGSRGILMEHAALAQLRAESAAAKAPASASHDPGARSVPPSAGAMQRSGATSRPLSPPAQGGPPAARATQLPGGTLASRPLAPAAPTHAPPRSSSAATPTQARPTSPAAPALPRTIFELPKVQPVREEERQTLDEIRRELGDCQRCKLCSGRKNIVFGVGNPRAQLVFVGEGPGADEDQQGVPFVGKAGQLLTKMIEAMGFARDDVYICNVVKCRPPQNRNPELDEIFACEPFLRAQLGAIQPKVIVALGKFAAQTLLRDETRISALRGHWREYCGVPLMPTFHPAYLLRNPAEKKAAWSDLQQVMKVFGKAPAGKS